jgi:hypothetical protein
MKFKALNETAIWGNLRAYFELSVTSFAANQTPY